MAAKGKAMAKEEEMEYGMEGCCGCGCHKGTFVLTGAILVVLGLAAMYGASLPALAVLLGLLLILKGLVKMALHY